MAQALEQADEIVVEVGNLDDKGAMAREFQAMAAAEGRPPLSQRVAPQFRKPLLALLKRADLDDNGFSRMDTWAAALTVATAPIVAYAAQITDDLAKLRQAIAALDAAFKPKSDHDAKPEPSFADLVSDSVNRIAS